MLHLRDHWRPFFSDPSAALVVAAERSRDAALRAEIQRFAPDLPVHFLGGPALYLNRFLATPSNEVLACLSFARSHGLRLIVGEDQEARFHSINLTKRALCRPVIAALGAPLGRRAKPWVDVARAEGRAIRTLTTSDGLPLVKHHHQLLRRMAPEVLIRDETDWVSSLGRGDLARQYDALFAGLIAGPVMLEAYYPSDQAFVEEIVLPAFHRTLGRFGMVPLIAELFDITGEHPEEILTAYVPAILEPAQCGS